MKSWLRRIRGAIGMGVTWAIGWTLVGLAGMMGVYTLFPDLPDIFDVWLPVFAYPGFLAGVSFSVVLRLAEGRRSFDELSFPRFVAWGALGGLLLGAFVTALAFREVPIAGLAVFAGTTTLLGAGSAWGTLAVAKMADDRPLLEGGEERRATRSPR